MDWHGRCHDNGMSGKCGRECGAFIDGECEVEDEIKERDPLCYDCKWCDSYYGCTHEKHYHYRYRDVRDHYNNETVPGWCPIKTNNEKTERKTKENNMTTEKMDFEAKTAQMKGNAITAIDTVKNTVIMMQQGKTVVTAVKAALKKTPACPEGLKLLLDTPYGDMVVGLLLHTTAPILTGNPTIIKAVKAANVAGAVELSNSITFIQDAVESAISSIPGFDAMAGMAADKIDDLTGQGVGTEQEPTEGGE